MSRSHPLSRAVVALGLLTAAGCAVSTTTTASVAGRPRMEWSNNRLDAVEIASAQVQTAWDAVSRLRPNFMSSTRASFHQEPRVVYLDGMKLGTLGELRHIPAVSIREIRMMSGVDAYLRYGPGHSGGVIEVITRAP